MANRTNRRHRGAPPQYARNGSRNRTALLDENSLQERSRRLVERGTAEWKPSSLTTQQEDDADSRQHPITHTDSGRVRAVLRVISWVLIGLSVLGFFILMWLPTRPFQLVLAVSIVFGVGVLSLFIVSSGKGDNPLLDENGTAL